jgi:hypothetical protein
VQELKQRGRRYYPQVIKLEEKLTFCQSQMTSLVFYIFVQIKKIPLIKNQNSSFVPNIFSYRKIKNFQSFMPPNFNFATLVKIPPAAHPPRTKPLG